MMQDVNIIEELFLSTEIYSVLGPFILVVIGYMFAKKDHFLGALFVIVEYIFAAYYLTLVDVTPFFWWHVYLLFFGGILSYALSFSGR
jgi:hypothetical protein